MDHCLDLFTPLHTDLRLRFLRLSTKKCPHMLRSCKQLRKVLVGKQYNRAHAWAFTWACQLSVLPFLLIKKTCLNDISFAVGITFSETSDPHVLPAEAINKITVICSYRYIRNNFIVINSYSVDWLVPWLTCVFFYLQ